MNTFSRYSVLSSEVDLDKGHRQPKSKPKTKAKKPTVAPKAKPAPVAKKIKKKAQISELQALAFGKVKKGKSSGESQSKSNNKLVNGDTNSLEDDDNGWLERDEEYVSSHNEKSLEEAILQSKLDYEKSVKNSKKLKTPEVKSPTPAKSSKVKKKKDKPITLSLNEFNNLEEKELKSLRNGDVVKTSKQNSKDHNPEKFNEEKFFKEVEEATQKTLEKEDRKKQFAESNSKKNEINHQIQVDKFISEIEKRDFEIQALRLEVDSLRSQLLSVKTRNKKLCEIISHSEMRSKGELVMELERAKKGRDEYSESLTDLNAELEQEKTKVSQLTLELKKLQQKKRNADSSSK